MDSAGVYTLADIDVTTPLTARVYTPVTRLDGMTAAMFEANLRYGGGGTSLSATVQTSLDGGVSWLDVARFDFTTASQIKRASVSAAPAVDVDGIEALPEEGSNNGILGDRLRAVISSSGTYADTAFSLRVSVGEGVASVDLASEAEAIAGEDNSRMMTPLRTGQAIAEFEFPALDGGRPRSSAERARDMPSLRDMSSWDDGPDFPDQTDALSEAIAMAASGEIAGFCFPGEIFYIDHVPPAITGEDITIFCEPGAQIRRRSTSLAGGWLFCFGSDDAPATRCRILGGLRVLFQNTPDPDDFMLDFYRAVQCDYCDIRFSNAASLVRYGSLDYASTQCNVINCRGSAVAGLSALANILVQNGSSLTFDNWNCTASGDARGGGADSALIVLRPLPGCLIDTVRFISSGMQFFSQVFEPETEPKVVSPDGKPVGLLVDLTLGGKSVVNLWMVASFLDHTTQAAIRYKSNEGDTGYIRNHIIRGCRFSTDDGVVFDPDFKGSGVVRILHVDQNKCSIRLAGPFANLPSTGNIDVCSFDDNSLMDSNPSVPKPKGIVVANDGWSTSGNRFGPESTVSGLQVAISIENAAITRLMAIDNNAPHAAVGLLSEPEYDVADEDAPNRIVTHSSGSVSYKATLFDDDTFETESTGLVSIPLMTITLKANTYYELTAIVRWQSSALDNGIGLAFNAPGTPVFFVQSIYYSNNMSNSTANPTWGHTRTDGQSNLATGVDAVDSDMFAFCRCLIKTSSGGAIVLRCRSEGSVEGAKVRAMPGTSMSARELKAA